MRNQTQRIRPSADTFVRLLLTTVMGLVLVIMLVLNSHQASAQSSDQTPSDQELYGMSRDEIVAQLSTHYREAPVAGGIAANGSILEVFTSPDGLSWTIIVTRPRAIAES